MPLLLIAVVLVIAFALLASIVLVFVTPRPSLRTWRTWLTVVRFWVSGRGNDQQQRERPHGDSEVDP